VGAELFHADGPMGIHTDMSKVVFTSCTYFTNMPKNENIKIIHEFKMNDP
jgi:hypothetical protein